MYRASSIIVIVKTYVRNIRLEVSRTQIKGLEQMSVYMYLVVQWIQA